MIMNTLVLYEYYNNYRFYCNYYCVNPCSIINIIILSLKYTVQL